MALIPCAACQRHVYTTETICPFCQHELGTLDMTGGRRAPPARMSRAALVLLGMSSVACAGDTERSDDETSENTGSPNGGPSTTGNADGTTVTSTNAGTNTNAVSNTNVASNTNPATNTSDAVTNTGTVTAATTWAAVAAYGTPPMGGFGIGGTPAGGNGGTGGTGGGAAGEAGDVGGAGGTTPLPGTGGGGQPIYGAPPTPW